MKQRELGTNAGWEAHHKKKQSIAKRMPSFKGKRGKGSLNPPFRSKEDNSIQEGKGEVQNQ